MNIPSGGSSAYYFFFNRGEEYIASFSSQCNFGKMPTVIISNACSKHRNSSLLSWLSTARRLWDVAQVLILGTVQIVTFIPTALFLGSTENQRLRAEPRTDV